MTGAVDHEGRAAKVWRRLRAAIGIAASIVLAVVTLPQIPGIGWKLLLGGFYFAVLVDSLFLWLGRSGVLDALGALLKRVTTRRPEA